MRLPVQIDPRAAGRVRLAAWAALAAVALAIPFFFSAYAVGELTLVLAYAVAALGLNLIVGYNGQISIGHGAFFALGAYTAAILIAKTAVPALLALPAAAAVGYITGYLFGVPALRVRGIYLALITLSLAVAAPPIIRRADVLTEGSAGLPFDKPQAPSWLGLAEDQFTYLLVLAVAAVCFVLAINLTRGDAGRAIMAVRDNEIAARTIGVDLASVKTRVFAWSAMYAAVGGSLYAFAIGFVAPESFQLTLSFAILAAVVIGGLGTVTGALYGALFLQYVPRYAADVDEALTGVIYGGLLILAVFVFRGGVAGTLRSAGRRVVVFAERQEAPRTRTPEAAAERTPASLPGEV